MKRLLALAPLAMLLAGCTVSSSGSPSTTSPTPVDEMSIARDNCLTAYTELPHSIETLAEQSGEEADTSTPCDNWVESQGEDGFIDFWTDPAKYIPYVISEGKLETFAELGYS